MAAQIIFDQTGISAGSPGARTDGLANGAKITARNASGAPCRCELLWVPPEDTTSLASLEAESDDEWSWTPTASTYGSWRLRMIEAEGTPQESEDVKVFGVRTPNLGLLIPAFNERGDQSVTLASSDQQKTDAARITDNNEAYEGLDYLGWWKAQRDVIMSADTAAESAGRATGVRCSPPGPVFTFTGGGVYDDVTVANGDLILLTEQGNPLTNGPWVIGTPWVRPPGFEDGKDASGSFFFVAEGTTRGGTGWECRNRKGNATVGTQPLTFERFAPTQMLSSYTALRDVKLWLEGQTFVVSGRSAINDGGAGVFVCRNSGVPASFVDDDGIVLVPTGNDGSVCFERVYTGPVDPRWWGAKFDGTSDDTAAIQAALNKASVFLPPGNTRTTDTLTMPIGCVVMGSGRGVTSIVCDHVEDGLAFEDAAVNAPVHAFVVVADLTLVTETHFPPNDPDSIGNDTGAGLVFFGGIYCVATRVVCRGFRDGFVLDQAEISTLDNCDAEFNKVSSYWLTCGPDRTPGAAIGVTNRITLSECNSNSSEVGILDDGGYGHAFVDCSFNGCSVYDVYASGTQGLRIEGHYTEGGDRALYCSAVTYNDAFAVGGNTIIALCNSQLYMPIASAVPACSVGNVESFVFSGNIVKLDAGQFAIDGLTGKVSGGGNFVYGGGSLIDEDSDGEGQLVDGARTIVLGYTPEKSPACKAYWEAGRGATLGATMRATGSGPPPAVTLSGTLTNQRPLRIEITTGGARGTAVFRWTVDGSTWFAGVLTAAAVVLADTGLTANFAVGTYATDNVYEGTAAALVDLTGNGNDLAQGTAANQMVLLPAVRNGRTALQGSATQWLYGAFAKKVLQPCTWYVVVQWPSSVAAGQYIVDSSTANRQALYVAFDASGKLGFYAATEVLSAAAIGTSNYVLLEVVFRGASSFADVAPEAAAETVTFGSPGVNAMDEVHLGRSSGGGAEFTGKIFAVALLHSEIAGAERARLRRKMTRMFNITAT